MHPVGDSWSGDSDRQRGFYPEKGSGSNEATELALSGEGVRD